MSSSRALFTGIVQGRARVVSARRSGESARLVIAFPAGSCEDVAVGASVSLNGTCLTATERSKAEESAETLISFDVVDETLRCTTLGGAAPGSELNFERSARLGDEVETTLHLVIATTKIGFQRIKRITSLSFKQKFYFSSHIKRRKSCVAY